MTDRRHRAPSCWILSSLALLLGCGRSPAPPPPAPEAKAPKPSPGPAAGFRTFHIADAKALRALREELGPAAFDRVLKLNRIDLRHARQGDQLLLPPDGRTWRELSPFPEAWTEAADPPQLLVVSLRLQAWAAYAEGRLVQWGPASTGKKASPTPAGLYHTNWCQRERRSTFNGEWLLKWYVNLHNRSGISFHQYDLPGYPDSHACIRLAADDAEWIYRWCRQWKLSPDQRTVLAEGTPVVVFGDYGWGQPKPWKRLADDAQAHHVAAAELEEALRILRQRVAPQDPGPAGTP